ncbi:cytochrome P450 [Suillus clintonianus]|uniref:cytochrome P450 n=1 Tax=Suillus clintonianus TaxID=1904413 RepID=UPI001B868745|nr:cytochrome P450 [Suillus clintonianus]KAG2147601.1 cytochrome P450 [Suillus clintonianus]
MPTYSVDANMSSLSPQGGFLVVVAAGLLCHFVFKRYEPTTPLSHMGLLVVVPAILTILFLPSASTFTRAIAFVYLLYYSTLLVSVIVYRLSPWHPLATYPGPIPCRISKFWMAWASRDGKQHLYYSRLHKTYGDVVRIGPNELSIRDVNAVAPLMGHNGLPKGPHWDGRMAEQSVIRTVISVRDPVEHARRRKPWHRAFSVTALKGYEEILGKRVQQFVTILEQQTKPINLSERISHFTFDFMSDMAFGGGSEMLRDGDKDNTWHLLENGLPTALILSHVPWLGKYYVKLPKIGELKKFRTFCQERAMLRRVQGSLNKDLFHYLIDEAGLERHTSPPTFAEVASDGVLAIVAGSDTTATTLSSLFLSLLKHPQTYYRLQAEVDSFFPPGEDILSTAHHPRMSYLNAVINETLRLFPPVLSGSQRGVPRGSDGKFVGPYFLPEGTSAFVHTYSLQRDPRNFSPSPDTFWPERWLTPEERAALPSFDSKGMDKFSVIHDTKAFVPFSFGPAHCIGKQLACQEIRMVVCAMMHRLNFRFAEGYDPESWERDLKDYFVATKGSLHVVLSPRNLTA